MTRSAAMSPAQRRWAVLLWVLVVAAALGQILRTSFTADLSAFLPANPDALTKHSALDVVELSGSQGIEILNWIAARGAMGDGVTEASRNYHIPISNTAAATVLMTTEHALVAA